MTSLTATSSASVRGPISEWSLWAVASAIVARLRKPVVRAETDEIGRFIADHGGVLTDSMEREIVRRFGN
jgi:hypothetical protein